MSVVEEGLGVGIRIHASGDGVFVAGSFTDYSEIVGMQFSVIGCVLLRWYFPHFAANLKRCLESKGHGIVGLDEVARKDTLQEAVAVLKRNEYDILLRPQSVYTPIHSDSCAPALA